ncbi:translocation/assembly module TamB domain-containing protein [Sphingomonas montanisoli]|uniref:Translocation/assembly module TamB n=1 Tax=Sphingomonas montanisoli TaxID=2606412 RepID=A0A5D9CAN4_9SPHN|nr:translocation/assembly module TamB domain-containing protein [Sphingomonas montanisoli]TZG28854.1 translocation/assembly module TamB [Sphingomonas montanisoli]
MSRALLLKIARGAGMALVGLLLLLAIAVAMLDTGPGHRLIVDRIAKIAPSSGLRVKIGRIDGSIWNKATIRDLRLYDARGLFLEAPEIALDWKPTAWMANRLSIDRLESDLVVLQRLPKLKPTTKKGPLLPGFDIHLGKLKIAHLRLGKAVPGVASVVRIDGRADIRKGRALIDLTAASNARDRLKIFVDAEPDANRFDVEARATGPDKGLLAGLIGFQRPVSGVVSGKGTWKVWKGQARLDLGDLRVVDLALTAEAGRYGLNGTLAPSKLLKGKLQRLTAPVIRVDGGAILSDRRLDGSIAVKTPEIEFTAAGILDLANNAFEKATLDGKLIKPPALFPNMTGRNIRLHAQFDGPFATADYSYALTADHVAFDNTGFDVVRADGKGKLSPAPVKLPVRLTARRVTGIGDIAGGILGNLKVDGILEITAKEVVGRKLKLSSDKLSGLVDLHLDLGTGDYDVALNGKLLRYLIPGLGIVDVNSELKVVPGAKGGTMVAGRGRAWVRRFDNSFLRYLAGGLPSIDTRMRRGPDGILHFDGLVLTAPSIRITGSGYRRRDGTFYFKGKGNQKQYGPLELTLDGNISRPKIDLLLVSPLDPLGLSDVGVKLEPTPEGFRYTAGGGSMLGPFTSNGAILLPANQPATIQVAAIDVSGAKGSGSLRSDPGGFSGRIDLAGGTVTGPMLFAVRGGVQAIEPHLLAQRAHFAAATPIDIGRGRFDGTILLDREGTTIDGRMGVVGLRMGAISLARGRADIKLKDGNGTIRSTVSGQRGRGFQFETSLTLAPDSMTLNGSGTIDRRPIAIDTPAVLRREGEGWRLAQTSLSFAGGKANVAGRFGGGANELHASMSAMPLSLLDMIFPQLGLSGTASGKLDYGAPGNGLPPTGRVNLNIKGMSRSGLVLSSRPADIAVAGVLTANSAAGRAIVSSGGKVVGRAQGRITNLPSGGALADRLRNGGLFGQLRYNGPADTLWRLIGVETIDISGPVAIGADVGGTVADPRIRGTVQTNAARLESAVSGTVINNIQAAGRFDGSKLLIDKLSGQTRGGGTIAGKASFDFAGGRGFGMDVQVNATNAQLLNRDDIGATVTGPLHLTSNGNGGTIAGDVRLNKSRFRLGRATAVAAIPHIKTTELNRADAGIDDVAPPAPWKLDIKADARNQLMVTGLGLDSEWRANVTIGGQIDNPAITGRADLVRGGYEFAGRRFDLDRGSIRFLGQAPPDPVLDIVAKANINGVSATISVTGTGLRPEINFTSVPSLPEDELLSRLLFGTSITNLSAPEALQLAAAVNSLRSSGGGLDPINAVRRATGLDRLRILPADPTTGQGTSLSVGKYIGRKTFVEVISDGAGYSATRVEFQITRWLSLLSSISTIGRQSASVRVSKDY